MSPTMPLPEGTDEGAGRLMPDRSLVSLNRLVWTALLAALIAVGSYLHFPLGPVPLTMQTFFVLLAGLILGPIGGALCVALFLAAGVIGLPVYSGGSSGVAHLLGPTGGFLFGFLPAAAIAGLATRNRSQQLTWRRGILWCALGTIVLCGLGVPWLKFALDFDWAKAIAVGFLKVLPGAVIKLLMAVASYRSMHKRGLLPT